MFKGIIDFHKLLRTKDRSEEIGEPVQERACSRRNYDITEKVSDLHHQTNISISAKDGLILDEML